MNIREVFFVTLTIYFAQALSAADHVVLAKIYPAREADDGSISSFDLQKELLALGCNCTCFSTFAEIENFILDHAKAGDLVITMGAGDVYKVGESLILR